MFFQNGLFLQGRSWEKATGSQVIIIQFNPSAKLGLFQRSRMTSARTSVSQMLRASFLRILAAVWVRRTRRSSRPNENKLTHAILVNVSVLQVSGRRMLHLPLASGNDKDMTNATANQEAFPFYQSAARACDTVCLTKVNHLQVKWVLLSSPVLLERRVWWASSRAITWTLISLQKQPSEVTPDW